MWEPTTYFYITSEFPGFVWCFNCLTNMFKIINEKCLRVNNIIILLRIFLTIIVSNKIVTITRNYLKITKTTKSLFEKKILNFKRLKKIKENTLLSEVKHCSTVKHITQIK